MENILGEDLLNLWISYKQLLLKLIGRFCLVKACRKVRRCLFTYKLRSVES